MKQLGDILLVIGGGMLCLVLASSLVRLGVIIPSVRTILWIFGGTSVLLGGLFARVYNDQSLRLSRPKVVDCYKAMAILTLNALLLYGGFELAASKLTSLMSRLTSVISSPAQE